MPSSRIIKIGMGETYRKIFNTIKACEEMRQFRENIKIVDVIKIKSIKFLFLIKSL